MKRLQWFSIFLVCMLLFSVTGCTPQNDAAPQNETPAATTAPESSLTPGAYQAVGHGNSGPVHVEVLIDETGIASVNVGEHNETAGLADPAIERIPLEIVAHQSVAVDAVSGATLTSKAICEAVADAIVQAGGKVEDYSTMVEKTAGDTEEYHTQLVVVGAGGSGMMAAVEAARAGIEVIVIEKSATPGGISAYGAGIGAVESSMQKEAGLTFTTKEVYDHMMEYSNAVVYAPLLRTILEQSADTAEWLAEQFGWDINVVTPNIWEGEVFDTYHLVYPYGLERFNPLIADFEKNGGTLLLETEGKSMIMENGKAAGVIAEKPNGTEVHIHAEAVVLATGGAIANEAMVFESTGTAEYITMQPSLSDGAGLRMAQEAGAVLANELFTQVSEIGMTPGIAPEPSFHINLLSSSALLFVNSNGDRYFNEGLFREQPLNQGGAASASMGAYYVIFDQETLETLVSNGLKGLLPEEEAKRQTSQLEKLSFYGSTSGVPPMFAGANEPLADLEREMAFGMENGYVWKADSIAELQQMTSLHNLEKTVDRYSELVVAKEDTDLFKRDVYLVEIEEGPFYAVKFMPGVFSTLGGVKVNEKLEAVDAKNAPVPGLYVAGIDGGSMFHKPYYDICGTTMMYAFGSGRIAGREAAAYISETQN
ncbi:FAD-dependent oxidoreductase [Anoxynatronum buryatiense]|uniref:Urocanate reductase n=1 Tax=Anoxynatronum buryatiense TaxID=489973 RepID=A0AA45WZN5_9CLOT|nr:FAD-dependent oxidoreductase [Anoxynatronum buryatiense]SMP68761.1 fumarate reductase flavoprotein subunit [Anoxynatronum buryatiense]